MLRKAPERTVEALWRTIGSSLDRFTPQECRGSQSIAALRVKLRESLVLRELEQT